MYKIITFYMYAFSRRFYPKRLIFHYIYILFRLYMFCPYVCFLFSSVRFYHSISM